MIRKLIFLGAPGVGKGTLAAELAKRHGLKHISTGEIFRNEIKNETVLGLKVKAILASGQYVSDEITNAIVKNVLSSPEVKKAGFILDGYPRTTNQAEFLEHENLAAEAVVLLEAPDHLVIKRLLGRGRADDNESIIKTRIDVYNVQTKPLIDFYKNKKQLIKVDASGQIEENMVKLEESVT